MTEKNPEHENHYMNALKDQITAKRRSQRMNSGTKPVEERRKEKSMKEDNYQSPRLDIILEYSV